MRNHAEMNDNHVAPPPSIIGPVSLKNETQSLKRRRGAPAMILKV